MVRTPLGLKVQKNLKVSNFNGSNQIAIERMTMTKNDDRTMAFF
jgi:hypothetical protein